MEVGGQVDVKSRYVAPTLISGVKHDSKIMAQEIFGELGMQAQHTHTPLGQDPCICGAMCRACQPPLTSLAPISPPAHVLCRPAAASAGGIERG